MRLLRASGALAVVLVLVLVLILVGRPLSTEDLWFHLKMGETYWTQGLWPLEDPMLFTGIRPVQHEWLFGVLVHLVQRLVGFQGLRVLALLLVGGTLTLAYSLFRREARARVPALWALLVFTVLAWPRFVQLRPDLITIPSALLLYRLLVEPARAPSRGAIAGALAILLLWVNVHSLFAVGLALLCAALLGLWFQGRLAHEMAPMTLAPTRAWARGVLITIGLGLLVTLVNPRGLGQHLTFFTSSSRSAIWAIDDEWFPFSPFWPLPPHNSMSLAPLTWLTTDLLMLAFFAAAAVSYRALRSERSERTLSRMAPPLFFMAGASLGAMFISIRFLWLSVFPLLYILRALRGALEEQPQREPLVTGCLSAFALLWLILFPSTSYWTKTASDTPLHPARYLALPYSKLRHQDSGVTFLKESGVSGRIYNPYGLGGYMGYWLAPQIRTFIDGRTEHYAAEVMEDFQRVEARVTSPGETFEQVLERRGVDLFFGVGGAAFHYDVSDTLLHVYGRPGWLLIYRSLEHAIYLRDNPKNAENLRRVAAYYQARGVPFDPRRGLDMDALVATASAWPWATKNRLLPGNFAVIRGAAEAKEPVDPAVRYRALDALAEHYRLIGAYRSQLAADQAALALRPDLPQPQARSQATRQLLRSLNVPLTPAETKAR